MIKVIKTMIDYEKRDSAYAVEAGYCGDSQSDRCD